EHGSLRQLSLYPTSISSAGMIRLLREETLDIRIVNLTLDTYLEYRKAGIPTLRVLRADGKVGEKVSSFYISNFKLTDEAFADMVAGIEHLMTNRPMEVYVNNNQLTDASIPTILKFRGLQFLYLSDNQFTDEGIQQLQQALPGCRIEQ
ncbi:MAG: hypothetical protein KDB23_33410, partial [Planctomycetales bacterium]|nr:hypothetical protein [Planctomycetales bacterium]